MPFLRHKPASRIPIVNCLNDRDLRSDTGSLRRQPYGDPVGLAFLRGVGLCGIQNSRSVVFMPVYRK